MSAFAKLVLLMVLTLPVGAYITGTLVASQAEVPGERPAIVIVDDSSASPSPTPSPTTRPSDRPTDDHVKVINPTPGHLDEHDDGGEDRSGRGNGGGDNSGPGGIGGDDSGSGSGDVDGSDDD